MPEQNQNLWTPWRMKYIENMARERQESGCFLCRYRDNPAADAANGVLWRTERTLVLLNRYPYTNGHLLIAPNLHVGDLDALPDDVLIEATLRARAARRVLQHALKAHGFNIGINLGDCAGAGLPEHLHWHIVPRWNGDTSFMASVGAVRLIPQSLDDVRAAFVRSAAELGLAAG
ncbi:MAG: HIT domain-containing protein [Planctomycetes bacterium]|nr:HIT domain-containing protein [Planctomycetota bacterium]